ncbi:MAG: ABC transporter permease subunit [Acidobacteriota bacterium]|nr:ABC transporter permease subunit [Acidobacteriota bacterium]MDQ5872684.1 ABC transporter permease subunit [Acidobacteriota bacterium]
MIEMVRRFLRQKLGSAGVVVALALLALLEIVHLASRGAATGFQMASWAVFVLAAGSVSRDVSSGALQMILSRPIHRTEYLFGRYLGILAAYAAFLAVTGASAFVAVKAIPSGASALSLPGLAVAGVGAFFAGSLQAAILLFFSTFLPGIADLLGLLMLYLILNLPPWKAAWLREAARLGRENLIPTVPWNEVLRGDGILGVATGRWVFATCLYLALAAVVFCRRELPYGQD